MGTWLWASLKCSVLHSTFVGSGGLAFEASTMWGVKSCSQKLQFGSTGNCRSCSIAPC